MKKIGTYKKKTGNRSRKENYVSSRCSFFSFFFFYIIYTAFVFSFFYLFINNIDYSLEWCIANNFPFLFLLMKVHLNFICVENPY